MTSTTDMILSRVANTPAGMFGVLMWYGRPFAVSLEDRWNFNARSASCIPAGTYVCERVMSPRFGDTFEVTNVPGRTHILFHKGNTADDTEGCILVAEKYGKLYDTDAVLASGEGFGEFKLLTEGLDKFSLAVRDYWL